MTHKTKDLDFHEYPLEVMYDRSAGFRDLMERRRSVRFFSDRDVPRALIEDAVQTASTAPSGAHKQPWRFVAVANPLRKKMIRERAEEEERESYDHRMPPEWLDAIAFLGTDWQKPFLEIVPWIVVCFAELYQDLDGERRKNYYVQESCGIACGLFIAAIHNMGLATLTHTPSPMGFLNEILDRPKNERPYMLFPVGYPAEDASVPDIRRKNLSDVLITYP